MLFKNFFDYLIKERNYSENTVKAYKKDLNTFSNFCISELKKNDINKKWLLIDAKMLFWEG